MNDQPEALTDEERDDRLQAAAEWGATTRRILEAAALAFRASAAQFATLFTSMQNAGRQDDFGLCPGPASAGGDDA